MYNSFLQSGSLEEVEIGHPTYHHFLGHGDSDSYLDKLIYSKDSQGEILNEILCKLQNPLVESHHDILINTWTVPRQSTVLENSGLVKAPRLPNERHRIVWSDEGIEAYQELLIPHLQRLQVLWAGPQSKSCVSLLMSSTSNILSTAARSTNKSFSFANRTLVKEKQSPRHIRALSRRLLQLWK